MRSHRFALCRAGVPLCAALGFATIGALSLTSNAGADVVTPTGACVGTATFPASGGMPLTTYSSQALTPGVTVPIPRSDVVAWSGKDVAGAAHSTGRRAIAGSISLSAPFGISIALWSWGGTSIKYANGGTTSYTIPSIAAHFKLTVSGYHDDAGTQTCSGKVNVQVAGGAFSNPLAPASLAGIVVFGAALVFAGRVKP